MDVRARRAASEGVASKTHPVVRSRVGVRGVVVEEEVLLFAATAATPEAPPAREMGAVSTERRVEREALVVAVRAFNWRTARV